MSDKDIVRRLMYNQDEDETEDETKKKSKKIKEISIKRANKSIILEDGGTRHQIPSMQAFNELLRENTNIQTALRNAQTDIKRLTETIKKMDRLVRDVERELANKADIYGEQ